MHESLSLRNLSKLPSYLRSRAKSAGDGSSSDLIFLLRLLREGNDPNRTLLLPVLFVHLDPSRIPTTEELDSILCNADRHPELCRVTGALAALYALSEILDAGLLASPVYVDFWPRLHRWIVFIHAYWDVIPANYLMDLKGTYHASATTILLLHRHDSIADAVTKTPGLRRILADFWTKVVRKATPNVEVAFILSFLQEEIQDANNFAEILEGIAGNEWDLAYLLVQQINDTVARPITELTSITLQAVSQILFTRIRGNSDELGSLGAGMLFHGGVKAVMDAIAYGDQARFIVGEPYGEQVYLGCLFLLGGFESRSGAEWLSQALSAGLLKLIASLGRSRPTPRDEIWYTFSLLERFLIKILPEYFVYYKIARQIRETLPDALVITSTAPFAKSIIYPFCTEFTQLVEERFGALDFFQSRRSISLKSCENMQCCKTGERSAFKCCAGCGLACYCSRECQKADWAAGHRRSCRTLGSTGPSNARERGYLRAILQYNFQSPAIRIDILTRQAQFMYRNPAVEFLTVFDLTRNARGTEWIDVPSGTGWSDVKPLSDYDAATPARLMQLVRSARAGGIRVHLAMLTLLDDASLDSSFFPLWSTPQLHNRLVRIVGALPPGLQPAKLNAALVAPVRALAASDAELIQEICY
ncbi:hypothetical protein FB451DRAFT_1177534 [Mycena latifolia]|nr:hypothetical protein FB451DRAFT_1177534 [Mycena latifolia]